MVPVETEDENELGNLESYPCLKCEGSGLLIPDYYRRILEDIDKDYRWETK